MTARIGAPKTGGRRRGSLDKGERQLVTAEMAGDLLTVYKKLGGVKWLLKFAEDNPAEFLRQGLSRLFPAPAKSDDEPGDTYNQFNFNHQDTFEIGRRVAFALNAGLYAQQELAPVAERVVPGTPEVSPQEACDWRNPCEPPAPQKDTPPRTYEAPDPERARWASELPLTPEERADAALVRETKEASITNYHGSSAEQSGSGLPRQVITRRPSVREIQNRRRELL